MFQLNACENPEQNILDKFKKLGKIGFSIECFTADFQAQLSKFSFCVAGWVLAFNSKYFRGFLEMTLFPKILSLKSCGKSVK